jgi:hypothetical protein
VFPGTTMAKIKENGVINIGALYVQEDIKDFQVPVNLIIE